MALTTSQPDVGTSWWTLIPCVTSHCGKSTCFSVVAYPDIPRAELIASALLQLKNNPQLFEKWRERQGDAFKANGLIFGETCRLTIDET
jgi:hypothetical protein